MDVLEDKDVLNRIVVPALQSTIVGGFALAAGITAINTGIIKDYPWQAAIPVSIMAGGLHFIYACKQTIPKKYRQVSFSKMENRASIYNQTTSVPIVKAKTWVTGEGWGEEFDSPLEVEKISRIGWHMTYLDGKLSHPYLVKKWEILERGELTVLQHDLVKREWAKWRGQEHKGGVKIFPVCQIYFRAYARLYKPDEEERNEFNKKYGDPPSPAMRLELARKITGRALQTHIANTLLDENTA